VCWSAERDHLISLETVELLLRRDHTVHRLSAIDAELRLAECALADLRRIGSKEACRLEEAEMMVQHLTEEHHVAYREVRFINDIVHGRRTQATAMTIRPIIRVNLDRPAAAIGRSPWKAARNIERAFSWFSAFVPVRIANEELGDALEQIHAHVKAGCPALWVYVYGVMSIFWITIHAVVDAFKGKK
jgi:hypothetical protein